MKNSLKDTIFFPRSPLVVRCILYVELVYEYVMVIVNAWESSAGRAIISPKYY